MNRHVFKLVWNRKRANALVIAEIAVCFLVLFAVLTTSLYAIGNYHRPLGFDYQHVVKVDVEYGQSRDREGQTHRTGPAREEPPAANPNESRQRALLQVVQGDPAVEAAAWGAPLPMSQSNEATAYVLRGRDIRYSLARVTDEFQAVMGLEITRGRWFSPEDEGAPYEPAVISAALAKVAFGDEDPVGRSLTEDRDPGDASPAKARRVVGVMRAFRQEGEMDTTDNYALLRVDYASDAMRSMAGLVLRVRPGADASAEARLTTALQTAAPEWSFKIEPLELSADFNRRLALAPLLLALVVAGFLILMVALGLSGVLWQSVTTRSREIGVRRALGASAWDVRRQVLGEMFVMATLAMTVGLAVVLQFPFLDLLGPVPTRVFFEGLSLTIVALYALALACALHPARLATTVHPAEALRYE